MVFTRALIAVFWTLATLTGAQTAQYECNPEFPYKDGWLGGDGVYSVPLSEDTSVWLFGDTFVGEAGVTDRSQSKLIANSVALSTCTDGQWTIDYTWGDGPAPFFESADEGVRYWPLDGFVHEGILTVFLMRVETVDPTNPFGFAVTGTDMARIRNLQEAPAKWSVDILPLARERALTGAAIIKRKNHVVLATPLEGEDFPGHPVKLTRLPYDRLEDGLAAIETRIPRRRWADRLRIRGGLTVIPQASAEMSLDRLPAPHGRYKKWFAVHMDPTPFSPEIVMRTAPALDGPWSSPQPLYTIPQADQDGVFCYAGKAHAQFARPGAGEVLLTYACNTFAFERLIGDLDLYHPHVVRVSLP